LSGFSIQGPTQLPLRQPFAGWHTLICQPTVIDLQRGTQVGDGEVLLQGIVTCPSFSSQ
jgi:hypothetical protein